MPTATKESPKKSRTKKPHIYKVVQGDNVRLVRAFSRSQAMGKIRTVATIATQDDLVYHLPNLTVEEAVEDND